MPDCLMNLKVLYEQEVPLCKPYTPPKLPKSSLLLIPFPYIRVLHCSSLRVPTLLPPTVIGQINLLKLAELD